MNTQSIYDVIICGGGLAGQTLARQLKLTQPHLSTLVLEKATFPRPLAALKVGESTGENAAFYLAEILKLSDHLRNEHFRKLGVRFFWTDPTRGLVEQPEIGLTHYSPYPSYQLDRGKLENYLAAENQAMGVTLVEGVQVKDIELATDGRLHQVTYQSGDKQKELQTVQARWVIDAMGRRCYLQKKLKQLIPSKRVHSAVWFRVKGRVDLADLVPDTERTWHEQVPDNARYYSTNHLMGKGYWVWIIPLASNHTSVGIVAREPHHQLSDFSTLEHALSWLAKNEPVFYQYLKQFEVVDFLALRDYTFLSSKVFSEQRWACTGDAALFSDPFFSPGIGVLSYLNTMIAKMIEVDTVDQLTAAQVQHFNRFARGITEYDAWLLQEPYEYFHQPHVWSLRYLWGLAITFGFSYPVAFDQLYLDVKKNEKLSAFNAAIVQLSFKMDELFVEWAAKTQQRFTFQFIDYLALPFIHDLYTRNIKQHDDFEQVLDNYRFTAAKLEEFSQVIFRMAVRDVTPERLAELPDPLWLNPQAISLDPSRWAKEGLFRPKGAPRDLTAMQAQVEQFYTFKAEAH